VVKVSSEGSSDSSSVLSSLVVLISAFVCLGSVFLIGDSFLTSASIGDLISIFSPFFETSVFTSCFSDLTVFFLESRSISPTFLGPESVLDAFTTSSAFAFTAALA